LILGAGDSLAGRLLLIDALGARFRTVRVRRNPACPACGTRELRELIDYDQFCGTGHEEPEIDAGVPEITVRQLAEKLQRHDEFDLIDVREPHEVDIARIPGARLIPLGDVAGALATFDGARDLVIHCKSGRRSATAVR